MAVAALARRLDQRQLSQRTGRRNKFFFRHLPKHNLHAEPRERPHLLVQEREQRRIVDQLAALVSIRLAGGVEAPLGQLHAHRIDNEMRRRHHDTEEREIRAHAPEQAAGGGGLVDERTAKR